MSERKISSFLFSVDGVLGKEALVVLSGLSLIMAAKTEEPKFHVRIWVNGLNCNISCNIVLTYDQGRSSPLWES